MPRRAVLDIQYILLVDRPTLTVSSATQAKISSENTRAGLRARNNGLEVNIYPYKNPPKQANAATLRSIAIAICKHPLRRASDEDSRPALSQI